LAVAAESDSKAIKRLTAAREYLDGLSPEGIEDKYGWHHQTIYNWLNRLEERGFEAALYDDSRPGRPSELTDDQFQQFATVLQNLPKEADYDASAWSSALAQQYLIEAFDVAFFSPTYSSTRARSRGLAEETPATTSLC